LYLIRPTVAQDPLTAGAAPGEELGASDRWRALARIVRDAFGSPDDREVPGRVADGFLTLLGGDTAALFRSGAAELDVLAVASQGAGPTEPAHAAALVHPVMVSAIKERRAVATPGPRTSSAVLAVPLRGRRRIVGALTVMRRPGGRFTPLDVEIAEAFADEAATFLELLWPPAALGATARATEGAQSQVIEAERLRAVGQLAGGVAHHLNNIMTVILGNIHVALGFDADVGMRNHLESAERAVLEAADVVRRMSAFSRVRPVPVGAIDALPAGGDIVVRTWRGEATVYCSVSDNGVGMAVGTSQRALEPFFTTKGPQSRGLGLSVAYGIVQRHSGSLAIDSRAGRGSTVTVSLPIGTVRAVPHDDRPTLAQSPRVLLVDDDAMVRTVLRALLTRDGYTVVEAADGLDALNRVERGESFDLVLTDLVMPEVNGWQILRGVRRLRPGLPVVLITGWEQTDPEGDDAPDAVVTKPVTDVDLRATVASVLGRPSSPVA
jgi:signal transduction histidine kinase